jgi:hypothetical protein
LAAVLSVKFFEQSHPVAALLSTIALFTAGFLIRPLGHSSSDGWATGLAASTRSSLRSAEFVHRYRR